MISEHLSQAQLTAYYERTLDPQELLAADTHLESCDVCHERLTRIPPVANLNLSNLSESDEGPFHLDYEQHLEPYVDGTANDIDREIVDSHVAQCPKCASDLKDLLEFKQQPIAVDARTSSLWSQWLPQWALTPAWATAAVVMSVFVVAGSVLLYRSSLRTAETISPQAIPTPGTTELDARIEPSPEAKGMAQLRTRREEPLVVLNDAGGEVIVNQRGRLEGLKELSPDLIKSIEQALITRRLSASPALKGWLTITNTLRGALDMQSTFAPLEPVGVVIQNDRPTFRWRPLEGGHSCVVTIFDTKLRKVAGSGPLTRKEWTIPTPLPRGVTYLWQISTVKDGETFVSPKPPLPEARFRVLDQRAVDALAKLKETSGSSHLAMGVFYWKHGLVDEAEREFQALADANPDSPVAKELLASIQRH